MAEDQNQTFSLWPVGTIADASTSHPNGIDDVTGAIIIFEPGSAIDNNRTTKWNDNTDDVFPDWLLITPEDSVYLSGLVILSEVGWITDFSIGVNADYSITNWTTEATVHNDPNIFTNITFPQPTFCSQLNITVFNSSTGDYSRICEVYPVYASLPASTPSTSSPPSSTASTTASASTSSPTSAATTHTGLSTGAKAGIGVGAAIAGVLIIVVTMLMFSRRRRTTTRPHNWSANSGWPAYETRELGPSEPRRELEGSRGYSARGGPVRQSTNELE